MTQISYRQCVHKIQHNIFYWIQYGEVTYRINKFIAKENYIIWKVQERN